MCSGTCPALGHAPDLSLLAAQMGIPQEVLDDITAVSGELSKARRKRAVPEGTATAEQVAELRVASSFPLHKVSQPGILALDLQPGQVRTWEHRGAGSGHSCGVTGRATRRHY